jgi:16S rRNA processing protein RimM
MGNTQDASEADFVRVGRVIGAHGLKGELSVLPLTDWPERFMEIRKVHASSGGAAGAWKRIEKARLANDRVLVKFEGIDDRTAAEALRGFMLSIPRAECKPLPDGTYFIFDLIGLSAETETGERLGIVKDVMRLPGQNLLVVDRDGREILIPMTRSLVKSVSPEDRKVVIEAVEGLLDE